ncbi:MAG TPA: hypothetical protein VNN21_02025 [Dehalococcoidia bacterium]|nr:hypothetical protein [Dehalococcoidia bacterium]
MLEKLAEALRAEGMSVRWVDDAAQAGTLDGADFDVAAFGRGIDAATRNDLRKALSARNPKLAFVEGLAPIIPLLVDQVLYARAEAAGAPRALADFAWQEGGKLEFSFRLDRDCEVEIDLHHLNPLYMARRVSLYRGRQPAGECRIATGRRLPRFGESYVSVRAEGRVAAVERLK